MSHLFDVTPEEPERRKSRGRKATTAPGQPQEPATPRVYPAWSAAAPLGTLDDGVPCLDQNCQAQCHDIIDEARGKWLLECCFCGTGQWIPAIKGHLRQEGEFRLRGGRFDGMTLAQASRQPRGLEYITWASVEHPRPAVREAAKTWLAGNRAGV